MEHNPHLQLEDLEKRLKETPTYELAKCKLLELQIKNLKNKIRADRGAEERSPEPVTEAAQKAAEKAKNESQAKRVPEENHGVSGIPQPPRTGGIPKLSRWELSSRADRQIAHDTGGQIRAESPGFARFTAHFGVVPVTHDMERGLNRIRVGFDRARQQLEAMGKADLASEVHWFEAKYTQAYLESALLPEALKIARRAADTGYYVVFACEHSRNLSHRIRPLEWITLDELDLASGGILKPILPSVRDTLSALQAQFGNVADYTKGIGSSERRRELREDFLAGRLRIICTQYGAGMVARPLCDADYHYPEFGITGGTRPRVSIFLSPPLSGDLVKDAVRLTWRASAKSDVHAVFLCTDSPRDVELMQQGVAPLLRALGASVVGEKASVASQISALTDEQKKEILDQALSYGEGSRVNVSATVNAVDYVSRRNRAVPIQDWSQINFPSAESAKRKEDHAPRELLDREVRAEYFSTFGLQRPCEGEMALAAENKDKQPIREMAALQILDPNSAFAAQCRSYRWGKFQGWAMVLIGLLDCIPIYGLGTIEKRTMWLSLLSAGVLTVFLGVGLLRKRRYGLILIYISIVLIGLGIVRSVVSPLWGVSIILWFLVPAIFYYPKRKDEFVHGVAINGSGTGSASRNGRQLKSIALDKLKSAGWAFLGILFLLGIAAIAGAFLGAAELLSEYALPWCSRLAALGFLLLIFGLLPASLVRRWRSFTSPAILVLSYAFGATVWMEGLVLTMSLWGTWAVVLGLFILGIGVVPIAMLATLFHGMWLRLAELVALIALTFGSRFIAVRLGEQLD